MKRCCQYEWTQEDELPFYRKQLVLDYYDGPLEGHVFCDQCCRGYYFKLLAWDDATQECRVFRFTRINYTMEQVIDIFKIKGKINIDGGFVPLESYVPRDMESLFPQTFTHICVSDNHFRTGIWRRVTVSEMSIVDWVKYLNLVPPTDAFY
jgi:hypothetical protein